MAPRQPPSTWRGKHPNSLPTSYTSHQETTLRSFSTPKISTNILPDSSEGAVLTLAEYQQRRDAERERALHTYTSADSSRSAIETQADAKRSLLSPPTATKSLKKRKRKRGNLASSMLSFPSDQEHNEDSATPSKNASKAPPTFAIHPKANPAIVNPPKLKNKGGCSDELLHRAVLEKQRRLSEEREKTLPICIPFVYFEGKNEYGGIVKVMKGDTVDKFLSGARRSGVGTGQNILPNEQADSPAAIQPPTLSKDWSRVRLDDLMLVRSGIIIPQYYDFYYFTSKQVKGYDGLLFDFALRPNHEGDNRQLMNEIPGADHNPNITKVIDKHWFEKNRHVYPVTIWEYFDSQKDYSTAIRRDVHGNPYHASSHIS